MRRVLRVSSSANTVAIRVLENTGVRHETIASFQGIPPFLGAVSFQMKRLSFHHACASFHAINAENDLRRQVDELAIALRRVD